MSSNLLHYRKCIYIKNIKYLNYLKPKGTFFTRHQYLKNICIMLISSLFSLIDYDDYVMRLVNKSKKLSIRIIYSVWKESYPYKQFYYNIVPGSCKNCKKVKLKVIYFSIFWQKINDFVMFICQKQIC